jgi:hypothetical protein
MFNDLIASSTKASFLNAIVGTNVVGSNLSLRNTIFRQAEKDSEVAGGHTISF